jgi:hypothetical protein
MNGDISMNHYPIRTGPRRWRALAGNITLSVLLVWLMFLYGCAATPDTPERVDNICDIFRENKKWYRDAHTAYKRWGVPIPVMMAIIHQESRFTADAKPPRRRCLWIFPGPRLSSAYGYAQAGKETWNHYQESTGNIGADRDDFRDAIDFVGWYCHMSHLNCGISKHDAYSLYLAYHEGHGGYNRKTYRNKGWLLAVAGKVRARSDTYKNQLASCEREFKKRPCCCLFWPF